MSSELPVLWHIPLSHFSEKARWALDYKGIAHRRTVLGANYLFRAWRATGRGTLPILHLDGQAIGDSTRIIEALEDRSSEPALYPRASAERQRALALEDYFDEQLGPAVARGGHHTAVPPRSRARAARPHHGYARAGLPQAAPRAPAVFSPLPPPDQRSRDSMATALRRARCSIASSPSCAPAAT